MGEWNGTPSHFECWHALRFQSNLPIKFWGECILTTGYLINRTPSSVLQFKSPYELLYGKPHTYSHLRVFGALCFVHNQKSKLDKFSSRSTRCIFVGYPFGKKRWKLFDVESREYFVSRDVVFYENEFPFTSSLSKPNASVVAPNVLCSVDKEEDLDEFSGVDEAAQPISE
ncbi:hypothetical protein LIER_22488 [Lithospermum erythrorhizon]|uniref:Retroviral polymerase SH3-like domain-containing protein n=1 Tax=Lithospermum erythrorhizon TaxID=34254 RepID=A0AAV3QXD8_LITER